jgi:hypothetical protein
MQLAKSLNSRGYFFTLAILSTVGGLVGGLMLPNQGVQATQQQPLRSKVAPKVAPKVTQFSAKHPVAVGASKNDESGEFVGPINDCNGDGITNDSGIDFSGDGIADECVTGREEIPEPPFQQTYTPTSEDFYSRLPDVGWSARYQCSDGLYEVTLSRPSEGELRYASEGLELTSEIVYDDIDPNLNQPLIIQDPLAGVRYQFEQERDGEFYEYALADYSGDVGLYVYQTGEQIVAAPCQLVQ